MQTEKNYIEADWKKLKNNITKWRENYLEAKNKEIISILADENKTPTEQFWEAKDKMVKFSRILIDSFDDLSCSKMIYRLLHMYNHGVISREDLVEFSDDLKEKLNFMCNIDDDNVLYELDLNPRPFNAIKAGTKKIEIRANTSGKIDFGKINANDIIVFENNENHEKIKCIVKRVAWYRTIHALLEQEGTKYTLSSTDDFEEGIRSINSLQGYKEVIEKNGVYAVELIYQQ